MDDPFWIALVPFGRRVGSVYIPKPFGSEQEARKALADLLRPYPEGHEWRAKLRVVQLPVSEARAEVMKRRSSGRKGRAFADRRRT